MRMWHLLVEPSGQIYIACLNTISGCWIHHHFLAEDPKNTWPSVCNVQNLHLTWRFGECTRKMMRWDVIPDTRRTDQSCCKAALTGRTETTTIQAQKTVRQSLRSIEGPDDAYILAWNITAFRFCGTSTRLGAKAWAVKWWTPEWQQHIPGYFG